MSDTVDDVRESVWSAVDASADRLTGLSRRLHAHPEVAWEEERAVSWLCQELADIGLDVEAGVCDLATAFHARIGGGPLHLAVCAEYDALPGIGHACGHNLIAAAAVGVAAALGPLADTLGITLHVLGTPAEEGAGGKITMLERGGFDGLHAAVMAHPGPFDVARSRPFAVSHLAVGYQGRSSHAAAYPELGVNAADAMTVAQVAIGLLRQQLPSSVRTHGIVTHGGEAPNIIPSRTEGHWYVRADSLAELDDVEHKVRRCLEAGAVATGCELDVQLTGPRYSELRTDGDLLDRYATHAGGLGRTFHDDDPRAAMSRASTDMGNVSQLLPAIHPYFGIGSWPHVNHQPEFAAATLHPEAESAMLQASTALALTLADAALSPDVRVRLTDGGPRDA
ncbi:MAG TPA: M20 family metallopeptidase [Actinomycetes bacterium]|nr:M20 family metallopeptidase [Actinomycetes bacterium]